MSDRAVTWARARYADLLSFTRHPGLLLAVAVFMLAAAVASAATGDWVSAVLGAAISVFCAVRGWALTHGRARGRARG